MRRLFRQQVSHRELLAIDPRALEVAFDQNEVKENACNDSIAIVSICGPLEHHESFLWDSYDSIVERLESAFCDDEVQAVVMCIDSPGGDAAGATEAHNKIQKLKSQYKKRLYAYSNESMYSAAYAVGSAADEIWVPETGGVGSVGVICALLDKTKANEQAGLNIKLLTTGARKADSHADRKLTDDVVAAMQERVDYLGEVFFKTVAKARGMKPKEVAKLQAGIFMGQSAIDSGLADNVGGWYKFLQHVSEQVGVPEIDADHDLSSSNSESAKEHAMNLAALMKAKELAAKKLAAAKSSDERTKLFAAYEKAATTLAEFQAKTKYVKKTEERLTKDEDEDEDEESADENAEESSEDAENADEDEESEESESSENDDDCDESDGKASSMSLKNVQRLYATASKITGKKNVSEIVGALEGLAPRVKKMPQVEQRLAKIETQNLKQRVKSMLDIAMKERRISPAQAKGLEPQGMKDPRWLKGYLSAQPPQLRSVDEGGFAPDLDTNAAASLDSQNLSADQKKMLMQAAQSAGMSIEDYTKEITKHSKPNGVAPKY